MERSKRGVRAVAGAAAVLPGMVGYFFLKPLDGRHAQVRVSAAGMPPSSLQGCIYGVPQLGMPAV
ncbi:hypothetical protein DJ030_00745 [bacterium endosymbiont of Escarpia laminata]|nr:MAG: hypothetical protein DJ031_03745 [bacterium endosymbiont of Escarpia laminata]RLJ22710.1 MAG: hypothetical protein DJ030_00745 [bacterium endosymbiont of Escarpia laminata]